MSLLKILQLTPARPAGGAGAAAKVAKAGAPAKDKRLADAADGWRKTHREADARIEKLKQAVKAHHADAPQALLDEIETGLARLDGVLDTVDHRLADAMARASQTADAAARQQELDTAKSIFREYIDYVKGEPLVAHMDGNPFGVKTDLKALLITGLTQAGKAIG